MAERQKPLSEVMANTSREMIERIRDLAVGISEELNNGSSFSPIKIAAALYIISQLSEAGSRIIDKSAGVIFPSKPKPEEIHQQESLPGAADGSAELLDKNPGPFGKLLRKKIEEKLLRPGETTFTIDRLSEIAKKFHLGIALNDVSDSSSTESLDREGAIDLIQKMLTTRSKRRRSDRSDNNRPQVYNRSHLMQLNGEKAKQLDIWAEEAGFDWKENKTISKQEADAILGLSNLGKLPEV